MILNGEIMIYPFYHVRITPFCS